MRAALLANSGDLDAGVVGHALRARGVSFVECVREAPDEWPHPGDVSLVLSLGSSWSTYWDEVRAEVRAEQGFLARAIATDVPVLGVCFGAQQLATVLGGEVRRAPVTEIGWHRVDPVPETSGSAPECLTSGHWMQWHYDGFSVPSGATVLARSVAGPQAFRAGRNLGLQFHPEATESVVSHWLRGGGADEVRAAGLDEDALMADTRAHQGDAARRCEELMDWFVTDVAQLHMTR